ncbi:glutathione transferase GstA [Achromobacter pestifer]|uniref:Glutathione transferase GstA n=1 Tax=Achromobacter pestifer TaxID=1353889 RepID=A0A7D4E9M3_9BURK|nr:glutathione transferase GstA [Achromobacter pestifer]QKH38351.1 glutathione transferase GstA [Achromobacter pestifer]
MKLYYSPGSCSLAVHIVLREANLPHELAKVDLWKHKTASGGDYYLINPKGSVPALEFDGGLLTEGPAITQYLADRYAPALVPANGTLERARLQEMLNYLSSEYHKSFTPLFYLAPSDDATDAQRPVIAKLAYLNSVLEDGRAYLMGDAFSVADAYLFALTRWCVKFRISLDAFSAFNGYMARVEARPAVKAALQAEGLEEQYGRR